jgi:uncharacterized protein YycO
MVTSDVTIAHQLPVAVLYSPAPQVVFLSTITGIIMKLISVAFATLLFTVGLMSNTAIAAEKLMTVETVNKDMAKLKGQKISVKGKVVKVNNGIMKRNFLHIQDGTGDANNNDLSVTSKQTANVGDEVTITGVVVLNRDFGMGYSYPLLIEEATIAK